MMTDIPTLEVLGIPKAIILKVLGSGIELILVKDGLPGDGITLGRHWPAWGIIEINGSIGRKVAAMEISKRTGVDFSAEEIFSWILLHEFAHFKGIRDESEADRFACGLLIEMRGRS